jgi:hypothetical protein
MRHLVVGFALAVAAARPAHATADCTKEVSQPIRDLICPGAVFYVTWFDCMFPSEVEYTTAPNTIMVHGKPENRNEASLLGVKVHLVDDRTREQGGAETMQGYGVYGDTLKVVMDLTGVDHLGFSFPPLRPEDKRDEQARSEWIASMGAQRVVLQTFDCILLNARRWWPQVRLVALDVKGPQIFDTLRNVYSLESVPDPRSACDWSEYSPGALRTSAVANPDSSSRP